VATEKELLKFCDRAKEMGALDAKVISPSEVYTEPWVRLKCQYGCGIYGTRLSCPPYSPTPEQTRSVLDCYSHAFLVRGNRSSNIRELVAELEREIFLAGFYKALAFGCGPCELCTTCEIENGCRYPEKARPSMEAAGIDVFATVRNAGLPIKVLTSISQRQERYGLVLVD
jgi:predicted metal-binding protein